MSNLKKFLFFLFVSFTYSVFAHAQMFAPEISQKKVSDTPKAAGEWSKFYNSPQNSSQEKKDTQFLKTGEVKDKGDKDVASAPEKEDVLNPENYIYKEVPQVDRPTLDGVKRGRTSVISLPTDGQKAISSEGYIYLFYSDFSVGRMMSGATTCDVRFLILSTLDRRLNSLAVRLKWPHMDTPVTFIDVNPNQRYEMTYTLLGDGCYSMDKIPNVVVNRCRVKGMTQEECARKIRWIRKI